MNMEEYGDYTRSRSIPMNPRTDPTGLPTCQVDDDHDEKPWQKNPRTDPTGLPTCQVDDDHDEKPWQKVPNIALLFLLCGYLVAGLVAQLIENDMPVPISENEIRKDDWQSFSEESAKAYLELLLGNGPRVAGTEYHLEKTVDLKALIDHVASEANLPVSTDWQSVSDDFWLDFSTPYVSSYHNVSNLMAVLEGESGFDSQGNTGSSILINCHYDSVPFAIGASDNGVFCAVMLEVLSKLSRREEKFLHNIVFLFNGAEENPLQGSHGFLNHPWSKGIISVINLDAAGMNGKPTVFQVSDKRIIDAYKQTVKRPNAQSFGEALFKSGIIPSDTDFRIWRDFGDIHGVDIAFTKWGCVYHTRNDKSQLIEDGVIQNAGDTILGMLGKLGNDPEMGEKVPVSSVVYYDYLNLFLVTYSSIAAFFIDMSVCLFALLTVAYYLSIVGFRRSSIEGVGWAAWGRILGIINGLVMGVITTLIMSLVANQLRYLSRPWLVIPFFWIPYFVGSLLFSLEYDKVSGQGGLNRSLRTLEAMASTRALLAMILLVLAIVPSLASLRYVISLPLACMSVASVISITAVKLRIKASHQLILEFFLSLPAFLFVCTVSLRLNAIMIPTAGRMPVHKPDFIVGGINLALATLASVIVSGIEFLYSRKRLWLPIGIISAISVILMLSPFSVYEEDGIATQRHYWFHSEIISYNFDGIETYRKSGILIPRIDAHTLITVKKLFPNGKWKEDINLDCERYVHCNLPLMRPRFEKLLNDSLFLYSGPPAGFEPAPSLNATRDCEENECTLYLSMMGTAHNVLTILPLNNELIKWSLATPLKSSDSFGGKPLYLIYHTMATFSDIKPFDFTLTFDMKNTSQSQPLVEISHHAHKTFHPEDFTREYRNFLSRTPKYFNVATTMSIRTNYVF